MHKIVLTNDLKPGGAQYGGAVGQPASGVGTWCMAMHNSQPHHTSIPLQATTHPCQNLILAPNLVGILSIYGMTDPQQIGAQCHPDSPQLHQNQVRLFQGSQSACGWSGLKTWHPWEGLVQASQPLNLEQCSTSHAALPCPGTRT